MLAIRAFVALVLVTAVVGDEGKKSYDGWSLVKAYPADSDQVDYLNALPEGDLGPELQLWQQGTITRPFDIFLSHLAKAQVLTTLEKLGIKYNTTLQNAQRAINAEKIPVSPRFRALVNVRNSAWFSKYLTLGEINAALDQLARSNPNLVQLETIGKGHKGNPIIVAKVSSKNGHGSKPAIWLDGGIHAREWISPATVLYILNKLVSTYNSDSAIRQLVDSTTWYIAPVLNPDGYEYTHTKDRMWRKNRRPNRCSGSRRCCDGVDLNRNFDFGFGGAGTSSNTCDETYRGPSAFSEPESQAVRNFVTSHGDIKASITLHSYAQMWFYPYGHKVHNYPTDVQELRTLANQGARALASLYGTRYEVGSAADLLYEAAGGSDDWAKGKAGIKYVYCLELRPGSRSGGNGFILPTSQIVPTAEETWVGLKVVADAVVTKFKPKVEESVPEENISDDGLVWIWT